MVESLANGELFRGSTKLSAWQNSKHLVWMKLNLYSYLDGCEM